MPTTTMTPSTRTARVEDVRSGPTKRIAAAVDEGSAVRVVHDYLAESIR
jgi:hypothetical protein